MTVHMTLIGDNIKPLMEAMNCREYKVFNCLIIYKNNYYKLSFMDTNLMMYTDAFKDEVNIIELTDEEVNRFISLWFISEDVETTFQSILDKLSKD